MTKPKTKLYVGFSTNPNGWVNSTLQQVHNLAVQATTRATEQFF